MSGKLSVQKRSKASMRSHVLPLQRRVGEVFFALNACDTYVAALLSVSRLRHSVRCSMRGSELQAEDASRYLA
eukprot:scaffold107076_cov102-Phaeocystis_antarctica.AAC.1